MVFFAFRNPLHSGTRNKNALKFGERDDDDTPKQQPPERKTISHRVSRAWLRSVHIAGYQAPICIDG